MILFILIIHSIRVNPRSFLFRVHFELLKLAFVQTLRIQVVKTNKYFMESIFNRIVALFSAFRSFLVIFLYAFFLYRYCLQTENVYKLITKTI